MSWSPGLRSRLLMVVLFGAVLPMAVMGYWLTRSAVRASEDLLLARLQEAATDAATEVRNTWPRPRGDLLTLAEDEAVQQELLGRLDSPEAAGPAPAGSPPPPESLVAAFDEIDARVIGIVVRDRAETAVWRLDRLPPEGTGAQARQPPLTVELPVYHPATGRRLGTLRADLLMSALLEAPPASVYAAGMLLAAFDAASGASLLPLPFQPELLAQESFDWAGDHWRTARVTLSEPAVELVAASPLTPVAEPFEQVARQGLGVLALVTLLAFALTLVFTGGVTRTIGRLTAAAEDVAGGDLDRHVPEIGADEVGRLGHAFNTMTASLRGTLDDLAERQALATVGEFASSLSHDVRNALTSIRLDLQMLGEGEPADPRARRLQERALRKVERLDDTVTGALALARSGRIERQTVKIAAPLAAAAEAAGPELRRHDATLRLPPAAELEVTVEGDPAALEQLFLNLLLNAAQAVAAGGEVSVTVATEAGRLVISIRDDGPGIPEDLRDQLFEPFVSGREGGTGLGLAIVRRIARAHRGDVSVRESSPAGTTVEVRLPMARAAGAVEHTERLLE